MGTLKSPGLTHSTPHLEMLNFCKLKMHTSPNVRKIFACKSLARQEMDVDRGIAAHTATFVAWHWITDIPQNLRLFLHVPSKLLGSCDASEAPLVKHAEGGASQLRYSKYVLEKWMNNSRM